MAAKTTEATRSLYRSFWRGLAIVARSNGARTANLRRLYRPQLRHALLLSNTTDHAEIRQTMHRTLTLLGSSPALTANLASLAYHHTPYPILNTNNANRLSSSSHRPIVWNPQEPLAAEKAHHKRHRDAERDPAVRISRRVEAGFERMWEEAERTGAGRVWLGRITETSRGGTADGT